MTRFTSDADLRPPGVKLTRGGIVVLAQRCRVAVRTHVVPVLRGPSPMQLVVTANMLARIQVKPALASLLFRPCVPRDRQRLHTTIGKRDEILLKGLDAEGVLDLEIGELAVRTIGVHEELAIATKKATPRTGVGELSVVEIAFDASVVCFRHCRLVL